MKSVIRANNIQTTTKHRLYKAGIVGDTFGTDGTFLRLRFYYMNAAMFSIPSNQERIEHMPLIKPEDLANTCRQQPFLLTIKAVTELTGADPAKIFPEMQRSNISPVTVPVESVLYGLRGNFYRSQDIGKVLDSLVAAAAQTGATIFSEGYRNQTRLLAGINIRHPEGKIGVTRSLQLFREDCAKILTPKATPPALTYDNINYNLLDWAEIIANPKFKQVCALVDCPNNVYLIKYLTTPAAARTEELLSSLSSKALDHRRQPQITADADDSAADRPQTKTRHKQSGENAYLNSLPDSPLEHKTIYAVVKHMMETEERQVADLGDAYRQLRGSHYTADFYIKELEKIADTVKLFPQYSDWSGSLVLKPRDLVELSGVDINLRKMIDGREQKISEVIKHFADTFGTHTYADVLDGNKFLLTDKVVDGRELQLIPSPTNIVMAIEMLLEYMANRR